MVQMYISIASLGKNKRHSIYYSLFTHVPTYLGCCDGGELWLPNYSKVTSQSVLTN